MVDIVLLGCGGTMPLKDRWLTSAFIRCQKTGILIDCGEGTQIAAAQQHISRSSIDVILLTHFHADHVSGLPGLLLTMGNEGRTEPVDIYGPEGISSVIPALCILVTLPFEVRLHELHEDAGLQTVCRIDSLCIEAFPVVHRIPCFGFRLTLSRCGKFNPERARELNIPLYLWGELQKNETATGPDGTVYRAADVLGAPRRGISVLYSTDTRPNGQLEQAMQGCDLAIIEGMFGDDEKRERAAETMHMTFPEAAFMAARAKPARVWLTHFSPSLPDPETYLPDVQQIYPAIELGFSGKSLNLRYPED